MSLATYYLDYGRHVARLRRRRRAYAPTSNTASQDNHEKINSWVSFAFLCVFEYGAPLGGRRSSAIIALVFKIVLLHLQELIYSFAINKIFFTNKSLLQSTIPNIMSLLELGSILISWLPIHFITSVQNFLA